MVNLASSLFLNQVITDPCVRAGWTTILPLILVGTLTIYRAVLKPLKITSLVPASLKIFFSRFLTLQSAEELVFKDKQVATPEISNGTNSPIDSKASSRPTTFVLASVGIIEVVSHLALGIYRLLSEDLVHHQSGLYRAWGPFVLSLCWVYATVGPIRQPIVTPSYDLFAFYVLFFLGLMAQVVGIFYDAYVAGIFTASLVEVAWTGFHVVCAIIVLVTTLRLPLNIPSSNIDRTQIVSHLVLFQITNV